MQVKEKKSLLWLTVFLGTLAAMAPLSTDMYLPSLPFMPEEFGVGISMIQLTLTMTMAGMAIGQIFAGPISDMKGRRLPLIVGMGVIGPILGRLREKRSGTGPPPVLGEPAGAPDAS